MFYFLSGEANHGAEKTNDLLHTLHSLTFLQSGSTPKRLEEALRRKEAGPGHAEEVLRKHVWAKAHGSFRIFRGGSKE